MLYAGLDLSRQRLDVHLLDEDGRTVEVTAVRPDADALRTLVATVGRHGEPVTAAIESMNGARFVHDQLELAGWDVEIADALKVIYEGAGRVKAVVADVSGLLRAGRSREVGRGHQGDERDPSGQSSIRGWSSWWACGRRGGSIKGAAVG